MSPRRSCRRRCPSCSATIRQTVVIKYGGHAMVDAKLAEGFARDIVMLEQASVKPVVVHGGGPQIARMLDRLDIKSEFSGGLARDRCRDRRGGRDGARRHDQQADREPDQPARRPCLRHLGQGRQSRGRAASSPRRSAIPNTNMEREIDLGFVGDPEEVNPRIVQVLAANEFIPGRGAAGLRPRRHHLQHQRRYLRERACGLAQGQAAPASDRRRRACSTGTRSSFTICRCPRPRP